MSLSTQERRGIVFDIQRTSLHDGPGVRTTVFLKGCPLRCLWCHNPESWNLLPQQAAPLHPGEPPTVYGRAMRIGEVLELVCKDRVYYELSGGGLTVSGGEPTLQRAFCLELLQAARTQGIHTCLDTCGFNRREVFEQLLPFVDLFHFDYKATGAALHRDLTGASNHLILANLDYLCSQGANIVLRCPLIPGINDTLEHLRHIAQLSQRYPQIQRIDVLPYHAGGEAKYDRLGISRPALPCAIPTAATEQQWLDSLHQLGAHTAVLA